MSGKFILPVKIKLWVASCFFFFLSSFLWVKNLKKYFFELQVVLYEWKIENFTLKVLQVESLQ